MKQRRILFYFTLMLSLILGLVACGPALPQSPESQTTDQAVQIEDSKSLSTEEKPEGEPTLEPAAEEAAQIPHSGDNAVEERREIEIEPSPDQSAEEAVDSDPQQAGEASASAGVMEVPDNLDTSATRLSEHRQFQATITSNLDPIAINQLHSWVLHLETPDGQPVENAEITPNGTMPQHNHGMPTLPQVTQELGNGDYLIEGMRFQMAGWWEIIFDISANDQQDTVVFNLLLEN